MSASYGWTSKMGRFGFCDLTDWIASVICSFPAPYSLAPLDGKYYGTVCLDASGRRILSAWEGKGGPSDREKKRFGDWTPEAWNDYVSDSHWEDAESLRIIERLIAARNSGNESLVYDMVPTLIGCMWEDDVLEEIACGGSLRRGLRDPDSSAYKRRSLSSC